jgi:hypothetical protein
VTSLRPGSILGCVALIQHSDQPTTWIHFGLCSSVNTVTSLRPGSILGCVAQSTQWPACDLDPFWALSISQHSDQPTTWIHGESGFDSWLEYSFLCFPLLPEHLWSPSKLLSVRWMPGIDVEMKRSNVPWSRLWRLRKTKKNLGTVCVLAEVRTDYFRIWSMFVARSTGSLVQRLICSVNVASSYCATFPLLSITS